MDTLVDKAIHRIKNNKLVATLIVLGIITVALGTVTGALSNIWDFATTLSKPTKSESVETQTNKSIDERQMKLEKKLNQLKKHHLEPKKVKKEKKIVISNSTENKTPVTEVQNPKSQITTREAVKQLVTTLRNIKDDNYYDDIYPSTLKQKPPIYKHFLLSTTLISTTYWCITCLGVPLLWIVAICHRLRH